MPRAPKVCSENGCSALVYDGGRKCEEHDIPWQGKTFDKRRTDTAAHRAFKRDVLRRAGHRCQVAYPGICDGLATEVDRIDNDGDYTEHNCQAACRSCHRKKTSAEGHRARGHRV